MPSKRSGLSRIVVGVDGSVHSDAAIDWAARMAKGMGSEVVAVFAIAPQVYFDMGYLAPVAPVELDPAWRAEMKKAFEQKWTKGLRDAGVRYRTVMEDGRPASVIAAVADRVDADVIVIGRRGRGGVAELVLGSVSHELVLHSRRPVLVIEGVAKPRSASVSSRRSPAPAARAVKGSKRKSR